MDALTALILYSLVYRCLIITAGVISISLGYRLFVLGLSASGKGTSIEGRGKGMNLSVKNAAPGTCFAVFGCVIIVVMLFRGPGFSVPAKTSQSLTVGCPAEPVGYNSRKAKNGAGTHDDKSIAHG